MPSGIPPSITTFASSLQDQIATAATYLQIPSYNATSTQFQIAFQDTYQASKSIYQFLQLTTRPLFILLALLSKYILIVLRIFSEHTIYHGIKASKEMWRQTKIATLWFIEFQKGLSRTAIYMEIGFLCLCVGLYMIRRYLQRKKYFQKLKRWYTKKKNKIQLKYNNFVDSIAQTSQVLALLLPHILYVTMTLALKYFTPSLVQYLANNTILSDVISFYIPFVRTIVVVYKYKNLCIIAEHERLESQKVIEDSLKKRSGNTVDENTISSKLTSRRGLLSLFSSSSAATSNSSSDTMNDYGKNITTTTTTTTSTTKKGKSHVADAYKKAATQGGSTHNNSSNFNTTKKKSSYKQKLKIVPTILHEDELNEISIEAAELLKYWIVYAILTALIQTATLLPIMGRIFYNANPINAKKAAASMSRWTSKNKNRVSFLDKIKLSTGILEECKLFFFAWLRMLPTSSTSNNQKESDVNATNSGKSGNDVMNRIKAFEKKAKYSSQKSTSIRRKKSNLGDQLSNQPLDIVYDRLAPIVISLVSTSTNFVNDASNDNSVSGRTVDPLQAFQVKCATFARTVLEAMVWTKIISDSTKNVVINTFLQCSSILPAAVTMVMPSYFTNYGIIYVRLIVPSANSSSSFDAFVALKKEVGVDNLIDANGLVDEKWLRVASSINHFLQYWIIQAIVSSILMSFAPVLAWIPLSTHMTWLLWAYVHLESTTKKLYNTLEWDLVAFGILKKHDTTLNGDKMQSVHNEIDVNETTSMQLFNSIMKKVPSNFSTLDSKEAKGNHDNEGSDGDDASNLTEQKHVLCEEVESQNAANVSIAEGDKESLRKAKEDETNAHKSNEEVNTDDVCRTVVSDGKEDYVCVTADTEVSKEVKEASNEIKK